MHAYIPCPFCYVTAEGIVHLPFTLPMLLLLCFCPLCFLMHSLFCPRGVIHLVYVYLLFRAYEFLSVLYIVLL